MTSEAELDTILDEARREGPAPQYRRQPAAVDPWPPGYTVTPSDVDPKVIVIKDPDGKLAYLYTWSNPMLFRMLQKMTGKG